MSIYSMTPEQQAASAAAVAAANNGKTASSGTGLEGDFSFFLKMLTTQLQNQDPTEPMDVTQMTQQIAQYSGVEQQVKTNTTLEKLIASNNQSQLATAVSYIGKEIETSGSTGMLAYAQNGSQVGSAQFSYTLPSNVSSVNVEVLNAEGEVVYSGAGPTTAGENTINWNGLATDGKTALEAGKYTIRVTAKDATGATIPDIGTGGEADLAYSTANYGQAVFSYMLPAGAQDAKITILNAAGAAVFTGSGTLNTGRNVVVWDGVNSFTGEAMEPGKYTIQVKAKDAKGTDLATVETRAVGTVDTVETDATGNIVLNVGDVQVKYNEILAVRDQTPIYVN